MIYIFGDEEKNGEARENKLKKLYDIANTLRDTRITKKEAYEENIRDVISQRKESDDHNHILFHLAMGNAYLRYAEMLFRENQNGYTYNQKALENFEKAKELSENENNIRYKSLVILNIGKCYRYIDDAKEAKVYFIKSYKLLSNEDDQKENLDIACEAINSIAEWYRDNAKNDEAMQFYKFTIKLINTREYQYIDQLHKKDIKNIERWYNEVSGLIQETLSWDFNGNLKKLQEQALLNIGIIMKRECNIEYAMKIFECLLQVDPQNTDAVNDIGVCYRKLNLINEAIYQFKSDENAKQTFFARLNLCKCYIVKDDNMAKKELDSLLSEFPHKSRVHILHAQYLMEHQEYSKAMEVLKQAKYEDKYLKRHYLKIDYLIACCYKRLNLYHEAIKIYSKILNHSEDNYDREDDCACLSNMADCFKALNFYDKAVYYYEKAYNNFNKRSLEFWQEKNYDKYISILKSGSAVQKLWNDEKANIEKDEELKQLELDQKRIYVNNSTQKNTYAQFFYNWGIALYNCYFELKTSNKDKYEKKLDEALEKFQEAQKYDSDKSIFVCFEAECLKEKFNLEKKNELKDEYEKKYGLIETSLYIDDEVNSKYIIYLIGKYKKEVGKSKEGLLDKIITYISNGIVYHSLRAVLDIIDLCYNELENRQDIQKIIYNSICKYKLLGSGNCELINTLLDSDNYKNIEKAKKGEVYCCLIKIYEQIIKIKNHCRYYSEIDDEKGNNEYKTQNPKCVHYTSLDTLKILLNKNNEESKPKFRLWNSSYMNDLAEGTVLVTQMVDMYVNNSDENKELKELMLRCYPDIKCGELDADDNGTLDIIQYYNSNMYLSSLSTAEDYLSMWVHYSNSATGCSIKFDDDFFDYNYHKPCDITSDDYDYSEFPLYNVKYLDQDIPDESELKKDIKRLYDILVETYKITKEMKENVYFLIRRLLDEVRFLFKDSHYSYEQEIRIMKSSVEPLIDYKTDIPRLYIEVNKEINIEEVRLAPKITDFRTIMPWLSECKNIEKIKKSNVKYK